MLSLLKSSSKVILHIYINIKFFLIGDFGKPGIDGLQGNIFMIINYHALTLFICYTKLNDFIIISN